jgi:hypothetical protein
MLTRLKHYHDHIHFPTPTCHGRYSVRCGDKLRDRGRNAHILAIERMVRPPYQPRTSMFEHQLISSLFSHMD